MIRNIIKNPITKATIDAITINGNKRIVLFRMNPRNENCSFSILFNTEGIIKKPLMTKKTSTPRYPDFNSPK